MIDLKPFCGKDETRPYLNAPWSKGDYTYVTNGHIGIRVARRQDVPETEEFRVDLQKVLDKAATEAGPLGSLPEDIPAESKIECWECGGTGINTCPACHNDEPCETCEETGLITESISVEIAPRAYVRAGYLSLVAALPNVKMDLVGVENAHYFEFDGGIGAVMGLRNPSAKHVPLKPEALGEAVRG
ncbi:hypothetical protein [Aestuariivirga sp.]|uniref:hypothetical protein n=1 Tax=Aestuariivirga sp. TaxID=2650926 RepID=UPI0039E38FD3